MNKILMSLIVIGIFSISIVSAATESNSSEETSISALQNVIAEQYVSEGYSEEQAYQLSIGNASIELEDIVNNPDINIIIEPNISREDAETLQDMIGVSLLAFLILGAVILFGIVMYGYVTNN